MLNFPAVNACAPMSTVTNASPTILPNLAFPSVTLLTEVKGNALAFVSGKKNIASVPTEPPTTPDVCIPTEIVAAPALANTVLVSIIHLEASIIAPLGIGFPSEANSKCI